MSGISVSLMERMDVRLQLLCTENFVRMVDIWRSKQPDVPNRSEAIRRMVEAQAQIKTIKPSKRQR